MLSFSFNETSNWARHCICVSNYVSVVVIKSMKYYSLNWCEIVGLLKCLDTSLTTPLLTRCISFMNTFMQQYFFIVNSTKPIKIIWYAQRKYALVLTRCLASRIKYLAKKHSYSYIHLILLISESSLSKCEKNVI